MMPAPGPPNGDGPNPRIDPEPDLSETNSETTSNNSPIRDHEFANFYQERHGRQFHTFPESRYFLPADDEESTRLKKQHEIFRSVLSQVYDQQLSPILSAGRADVLDLGCGPGTWVEEFAKVYQFAFFIGIDLVPMARQHVDRAQFECFDISNLGLQRQNRNVKVIHARCLSFGFKQFDSVLREAHEVLSPGGLLLSIEIDWRFEQQKDFRPLNMQATREFLRRVAACAMEANGRVAWDPTLIPNWLADAQFYNIQKADMDIPVGPWMASPSKKELGGLVKTMCIDFVDAMRPALLSLSSAELGGVDALDVGAVIADVDALIADVKKELESEEIDGWRIPVQVVTASKW